MRWGGGLLKALPVRRGALGESQRCLLRSSRRLPSAGRVHGGVVRGILRFRTVEEDEAAGAFSDEVLHD